MGNLCVKTLVAKKDWLCASVTFRKYIGMKKKKHLAPEQNVFNGELAGKKEKFKFFYSLKNYINQNASLINRISKKTTTVKIVEIHSSQPKSKTIYTQTTDQKEKSK